MIRFFEKLINPTAAPEHPEPPAKLIPFYWHYARQAKGLFILLFVIELFVALLDTAVPWFIGKVVTLVSTIPPDRFLADTWPWLVAMAVVMLVARPGIVFARYMVTNQALAGPFSNLIRWQSHWHVVRQSWAFFQNDFAGRISNRVMQTGPAVRESLVSSFTAVWYIVVYGTTALIMMAAVDLWLATPVLVWFAGYIALMAYFVPKMRDRSKITSEARSMLMGRIVDSYTNILTVKLFARPRDEDEYVRDAVEYHTGRMQAGQRLISAFGSILAVLNGVLVAGSGALALVLWRHGKVEVGAIAMVLPLTYQLTAMSRWIAFAITDIFEEVGVVQEGMMSIAVPLQLVDREDAEKLVVQKGRIAFEDVRFGYGREPSACEDGRERPYAVLDGFTSQRPPRREDRPGRPLGRREVDGGQSSAALL